MRICREFFKVARARLCEVNYRAGMACRNIQFFGERKSRRHGHGCEFCSIYKSISALPIFHEQRKCGRKVSFNPSDHTMMAGWRRGRAGRWKLTLNGIFWCGQFSLLRWEQWEMLSRVICVVNWHRHHSMSLMLFSTFCLHSIITCGASQLGKGLEVWSFHQAIVC